MAAWAIVALASGETGDNPKQPGNLIRALLDLPAPPPFFTSLGRPLREQGPPADDAPSDLLLDYWSDRVGLARRSKEESISPSEKTRNRLLEGCLRDPRSLPSLRNYLPETPRATEEVKRLYDQEKQAGKRQKWWMELFHHWLMTHSKYFRDELIQAARGATFKTQLLGWLEGKEELEALARLDWDQAEERLLSPRFRLQWEK